jgi:pyruvate-ferredoxin/flavodoxin oxidoreductase
MLQSKAGIVNKEYAAQRAILADVDAGKIPMADFLANAREILNERVSGGVLAKA